MLPNNQIYSSLYSQLLTTKTTLWANKLWNKFFMIKASPISVTWNSSKHNNLICEATFWATIAKGLSCTFYSQSKSITIKKITWSNLWRLSWTFNINSLKCNLCLFLNGTWSKNISIMKVLPQPKQNLEYSQNQFSNLVHHKHKVLGAFWEKTWVVKGHSYELWEQVQENFRKILQKDHHHFDWSLVLQGHYCFFQPQFFSQHNPSIGENIQAKGFAL